MSKNSHFEELRIAEKLLSFFGIDTKKNMVSGAIIEMHVERGISITVEYQKPLRDVDMTSAKTDEEMNELYCDLKQFKLTPIYGQRQVYQPGNQLTENE